MIRRRASARGGGAEGTSPAGSRLGQLEDKREQLRLRLTDRHPEVIALEREIAALRAQASDDTPSRESPMVRELSDQIALLDRQIAALERRRKVVQTEIATLEEDLKHAATISDEYRALQREYESAVSDYGVLRRKQLTADMGASLELNEKGERFTLIEPPRLPESPESPNRKLIAAGGLVGSFGFGAGLLLLMALLDRTVAGPRALEKLVGAPPLILVPTIPTKVDHVRTWAWRIGMVLVLAGGVAAVDAYLLPLEPLVDDLLARLGVEEGAASPSQAGG
jgi:hypothetical protein